MITQIKKDSLQARKDKNSIKSALLVTLIGEVEMVAKNDGQREVTDADCTAKIKAFLKGINASLEVAMGAEAIDALQAEKAILETYLPTQLTDRELEVAVEALIASVGASSPKDMGKVMGALKAQYDGMYDGKTASSIVRNALQG